MKKRTFSLRTRLTFLMALLVLLQSLALVLSLTLSRVFNMLDAEAFRLFNNTTNTRMQTFNGAVGELVYGMALDAGTLNRQLQNVAQAGGLMPRQLYMDDTAYDEAAMQGTQTLIDMLQSYRITGAFFILNGSNASKTAPNAHSAVYIRNSAPGGSRGETSTLLLEIGPIAVSRHYQITTSVNWNLDLTFDPAEEEARYALYNRPVWAAQQHMGDELERYGYWARPGAILHDNQHVVCYTMPLLDSGGEAYGVMGIEISLAYFTQYYLPNIDLPYTNSFYAIAPADGDGNPVLDWLIPSGPLAQVYLQQGGSLPLEPVAGSGLYETRLESLGKMYCSVQPLTIYSQNSPFYGEGWLLLGFVPQNELHQGSSQVRTTLISTMVLTIVGAFAAIFFLAYFSTRKISGLSRYISGLSPYQDIRFQRTGMREIDELTSAVEMLSKSVINASKTTSKILEMTLLPIGGFEVTADGDVVLTEFVYSLLHLEPGAPMTLGQWRATFAQITAHPAEGYENIYQYAEAGADEPRWLRILRNTTPAGEVGVILDVTKDIEENRRLAHELDYDALTHLYSRTAFKRESHARIQARPDKTGAMIFSDLDNLKYINDTFGHDMGDRLIIKAGEMFNEFTAGGGVVARISGDEFAIYLHGFSTKAEARKVIDAQFKRNEAYFLTTPDGSSHRIRSSSGLAWYPDDSDNVTDLLKLSDFAMYEAKHNQKGTLFEFNHDSYRQNAYLLENREAINRLLDEGLIRFAFQPIVDLRTGEIYAYEALMRPLLENFRSPMEILTVAAAQSKLGQLEHLVILKAFQAIDDLSARLGSTKIFINTIPSQVLNTDDLLLLERRYSHLFRHVVIEVTEAENNSPQQLNNKVSFVKKHNMLLAIDDFGSGYSNEMRILQMDPDIVKVDMSLIQGIYENTDKQKLVSNLVSFCHPKGIRLIAEGVEDYADLAELVRLEMDYVQGYYTGKPNYDLQPISPHVTAEIVRLAQGHGEPTV